MLAADGIGEPEHLQLFLQGPAEKGYFNIFGTIGSP